jgi:N-acylneuraminate cytidylyltransferase
MYATQGKHFDNLCCLLATCPLVKAEHITEAYNKLTTSDFISVYPVVQFSYPILRSLKMDADGGISMNWPEHYRTRSQDLAPAYHDSGTFYWHKLEPWLAGKKKAGGIVIDEDLVQDIDTEQDWKMAEMKYKIINNL